MQQLLIEPHTILMLVMCGFYFKCNKSLVNHWSLSEPVSSGLLSHGFLVNVMIDYSPPFSIISGASCRSWSTWVGTITPGGLLQYSNTGLLGDGLVGYNDH